MENKDDIRTQDALDAGTGTKFSDHLIDIKHYYRILKVNIVSY